MADVVWQRRVKAVLRQTVTLLGRSEASEWSALAPPEIAATLTAQLARLESGAGELDTAELQLLYAPTGSIQEIAMENGWGERYLDLADRLDELVELVAE